jgi:hypothetical protein
MQPWRSSSELARREQSWPSCGSSWLEQATAQEAVRQQRKDGSQPALGGKLRPLESTDRGSRGCMLAPALPPLAPTIGVQGGQRRPCC